MRVLVVEDDPLGARVLERVLARRGHDVRTLVLALGEGLAARLESVMHWPADVVVTDGLGGQCSLLVDLCCTARVPVVVYTGEPWRYRALNAEVVEKPGDVLVLVQRLEHLARP